MLPDAGKGMTAGKADLWNTSGGGELANGRSLKEFGAVCDVSVLADRDSFKLARQLIRGGELYLPSATYSWLARDRLISVRGQSIGYSLVNQFVRDGELLVVYLPELLDEISRRLLYGVDREVPLTDLRAAMLAAHLKMPILTLSDQFTERLNDHVGGQKIWQLDVHGNAGAILAAIELYGELASDLGSYLSRHQNGAEFEALVEELKRLRLDNLRAMAACLQKIRQPHHSGKLSLVYLGWDITHILREYLEQNIVPPEVVGKLYEKSLLLIASPAD